MPQDAMEVSLDDGRGTPPRDLAIEGKASEPAFEKIVALAADLFDVPMAAITIIGDGRRWCAASVGLEGAGTPICHSFCGQTIKAPDVLVVPDASKDPRFRDLPLVTESGVRFYAGAPLRAESGFEMGVFCIMDTKSRTPLSAREERLLAGFSDMAMGELESRRTRRFNAIAKGFADTTGASLVCTRADGRITYLNPSAERLLGYAAAELVDRDVVAIIPQRFVAAHRHGIARIAAGEPSRLTGRTFEAIVKRKDGGEVPVDLGLSVWRDPSGLGLNIGATMRDITERKQKEDRLHRLADYDPLTGLARAHGLSANLSSVLAESGVAAVLILEIDGLKGVNDGLGHAVGDALLQAVAIRLFAIVPPGAKVARWSGDAFAALLPNVRDPIKARECAHDIQMSLAEPFEIDGHTLIIGATVGAAIAPEHATETQELVAAADLALHNAKMDRGQKFRLFDPSMRSASAARRALRDDVRQAFAANQFVLFYQPQVSLETGEVVGAEALMRWRHPLRGIVAPGVFIPAMDESALALQAGWWSLDQACRQIAAWRAEKRPNLRMCVNLFAAQLLYGGLVTTVRELLATHDVSATQLTLEIRETIAHQDDDAVIAILRDLRGLGIGIALDDFGTGYASLRTLKRLPVSTIKIDQSFVRDIGADRHDIAIVSAILHVSRDFGLDVIAEGVETPVQSTALKRMGCPTAQGFLFGRPVPAHLFGPAGALAAIP